MAEESKAVSMFDTPQLPANETLAGSLRKLAAAKAAIGGKPFMRLAKSGKWEFGPESIVIEDAEKWAINPASFMVGMIGWKGGTVVGEEMYPLASEQRVDLGQLPEISSSDDADGWKDQLTVELRSMEDGTEGVFKTTALGGKNALADLAGKIGERMEDEDEGKQYCVPVCHLKVDSYLHKIKSRGRIYFPIFEIIEWIDDQGNAPGQRRALV